MNWLFFTRSNGDIDSMKDRADLDTDEKRRVFIGDEAINFQVIANDDLPKNAKWDGEKYISDISISEDARIISLESQCYAYQISRTGLKCPANFYALLIGAKAAGKLGPKVIACFVSLDLLWKLYETYKKDSSIEIEFDVAGTLPHSFDEIRTEIEA